MTVEADLFNPNVFYSRQIALPELREQGQEKLRRSRVAIVSLGGLGSVSALYLALAGVGLIRLIDQDTIEMRNLHSQILYPLEDILYSKVEAAARRIKRINPDVEVDHRSRERSRRQRWGAHQWSKCSCRWLRQHEATILNKRGMR